MSSVPDLCPAQIFDLSRVYNIITASKLNRGNDLLHLNLSDLPTLLILVFEVSKSTFDFTELLGLKRLRCLGGRKLYPSSPHPPPPALLSTGAGPGNSCQEETEEFVLWWWNVLLNEEEWRNIHFGRTGTGCQKPAGLPNKQPLKWFLERRQMT